MSGGLGPAARISGSLSAWASSVGSPLSISELAARADVIVLGVVVGARSAWDDTGSVIVTVVDVRPEELLKGGPGPSVLRVRHLGGRVGDQAMVVAGAPSFADGERVLLFLAGDPRRELTVVGLAQGKFTVTQDGLGRHVARYGEGRGQQEVLLDEARQLIRRAGGG